MWHQWLNFFLRKENKNNIIYSTILLPWVTSSAILESTQEHIWRTQRCLRSGGKRVHERNLRIKRCLCLGENVRMRCDTL